MAEKKVPYQVNGREHGAGRLRHCRVVNAAARSSGRQNLARHLVYPIAADLG